MERNNLFRTIVGTAEPSQSMSAGLLTFLKNFIGKHRLVEHEGMDVINTHFPPFPSDQFDRMLAQMLIYNENGRKHLYSVTLAVTNRCPYSCWHCYNYGRSQEDLPIEAFRSLSNDFEELGAVTLTLSGGEPLLRSDLEEIIAMNAGLSISLNTTGLGLSVERARSLKEAGLFAVGISLDSLDPSTHDRLRGCNGAYRTAVTGLVNAREAGLYPYIISVATREFLEPGHLWPFMEAAGEMGAKEVHLLEPCPTGKLAGRTDVILTQNERERLFQYQEAVADNDDLPVISTFADLEGPEAFGCGAGLTHLYIDGAGDVFPCNLVPLGFGNIAERPFKEILRDMRNQFQKPRTECAGKCLGECRKDGSVIRCPEISKAICESNLPEDHELPGFFKAQETESHSLGNTELKRAYNTVADHYQDAWLSRAAEPVQRLVDRLGDLSGASAFEAGCGTGYASALLAGKTRELLAADLSEAMLEKAEQRLAGMANVTLVCGDAVAQLEAERTFDLVFSSWVLGYMPLSPFFDKVYTHLNPGGRLAFITHKDRSPEKALSVYYDLIAGQPEALQHTIDFDFPANESDILRRLDKAGFSQVEITASSITFPCASSDDALRHLLESGAGTLFYEAVKPEYRQHLSERFVETYSHFDVYDVVHDYFTVIAWR